MTKMKAMISFLLAVLIGLSVDVSLAAQDTREEATEELSEQSAERPVEQQAAPPQTPTEIDTWRDTLRYGINTAVAELIPTLTRNRREELAPEIIELFLTSNDRVVLIAATEYLRELSITEGHVRGFELVNEYFDRPSDLITAVLRYLRETDADPNEEAREILLEISRMPPTTRAIAAVRLYAQADTDTETLIDLYQEPGIPDDVQGRILIEIGTRGDPRAFDFVREVIGDGEEATTSLQRFAIDTLGKLGDERAIPIILRQFNSSDAMTRAYATSALTNFDTEEADRALVSALRDQFWRVRIAALQAVADRNMEDALSAAIYMMRRDPERPVRLQAIRTVAQLDTETGWDALLERMADPRGNVEERGAIIEQAIRSNAQRSIPILEEIIQEEWEKRNSRILDAIGRTVSVSEDRALSPIIELLLNHPNYIIQLYGIRAAGRNRLARYADTLRMYEESEGSHRLVREAASNALQQIGPLGIESELETGEVAPDSN